MMGTSVFLHDTLATLVADLAAFVNPREQPEWVKNPETGELVKVLARLEENPEAGELAKVRERLEWAEKVESLSITNHESKWEEAREAIRDADGTSASSLYAEHPIDLEPQMGLVPIGMNPVTKLWEFYHLRSAADPTVIPEHDEAGNIEVTAETGIIFVLIPGGTFLMGAQKEDPAVPNYDPLAESNETPYHETLESYFLARHELTQAQWERLSGGEKPSREGSGRTNSMGGTVSLTHPVEEVSWDMCNELLTGHALDLPSEAQWEYACRAGTATPWFTGTDANSLAGHANILDETGAAEAPSWGNPEGFDDGFVIHAPVGSLLPNEFGMFDMHGNVWEWCREPFGTSSFPVTRGGSFQNPAQDARSANRDNYAPSVWDYLVGLRPARAIY